MAIEQRAPMAGASPAAHARWRSASSEILNLRSPRGFSAAESGGPSVSRRRSWQTDPHAQAEAKVGERLAGKKGSLGIIGLCACERSQVRCQPEVQGDLVQQTERHSQRCARPNAARIDVDGAGAARRMQRAGFRIQPKPTESPGRSVSLPSRLGNAAPSNTSASARGRLECWSSLESPDHPESDATRARAPAHTGPIGTQTPALTPNQIDPSVATDVSAAVDSDRPAVRRSLAGCLVPAETGRCCAIAGSIRARSSGATTSPRVQLSMNVAAAAGVWAVRSAVRPSPSTTRTIRPSATWRSCA